MTSDFVFEKDDLHAAIDGILKRGNDVEIRRKGDGYIVLEVKKTIKYLTDPKSLNYGGTADATREKKARC